MISQTNLNLLAALANTTQQAGNGLIALIVVDGATAQSMPVAGATVSSTPAAAAYRYDGTNALVSATATATGPDGVAYMFNVPPDVSVTVSATKTGSTFSSHSLKASVAPVSTSCPIVVARLPPDKPPVRGGTEHGRGHPR